MRRLTLACVLSGCIVVAVTGVMSAQSSPPSPEAAGQRVELPDVGLAITLPDGWRVNLPASSADFVSFDYMWAPFESCSLRQVGTDPRPDSDAIPDIYDEEVLTSTDVDLPAGAAVRTDSLIDIVTDGRRTVYAIATGGPAVELSCRAATPPDDRWLHLAEAIEVRPVAHDQPATDSAVLVDGFDGRVELPHLGFSLTFPSAWEVVGMPAGDDLASREPGGLAAQVTDDEGMDLAVCLVRTLRSPRSDEGRTTIETLLERLLELIEESPQYALVDSAFIDLPGGRAARVVMEGVDDAKPWVVYRFTDGDSRGGLTCGADVLPDDRWLSIAETVEFLPAAE